MCWHERHSDVLHGMHSPSVTFCLTFRSFWLSDCICTGDMLYRSIFKECYDCVALNIFPNVLIFNIFQCLLTIYLIFGEVGLHVTENGIMLFRAAIVLLS